MSGDAPVVSAAAGRAWWLRRTGLAGSPVAGTGDGPAALVAASGWLRALGGVDAYLALAARDPAMTRASVDAAVAAGALVVTPAVRNTVHIVDAAAVPLALAVAHDAWERPAHHDLERAGVGLAELAEVGDAVLDALADGPLTPAELHKVLPEGTVRHLGDEGRAVGISTTLPSALRLLELSGRLRRSPEGDRLDTERYHWELPPDGPLEVPPADEALWGALAVQFARTTAPFTVAELAAWAGVSQRRASAAVVAAGDRLTMVELEDAGEAWMPSGDLDGEPEDGIDPHAVHLLGFEDLALVAHKPAAWFRPVHHDLELPVWGMGSHTLGGASHLSMRAVVVGDRMAGFWGWDPDAADVELAMLDRVRGETAENLEAVRRRTAELIRSEFGHARLTSADSEATERSRVEALRALLESPSPARGA